MRSGLLSTLIVLMSICSTSAFAQDANKSSDKKPSKVAVVDLADIFEKWSKSTDTYQELKVAQDKEIAAIQKHQEAIKRLQFKLAKTNVKSKAYAKLQKKLEQKTKEVQNIIAATKRKLLLANRNATLKLYREIAKAIEVIANENSFDVVLQNDKPNLDSAVTPQELLKAIVNKKVLFSNKRSNITDLVLKRLEANYAKEKQAKKSAAK